MAVIERILPNELGGVALETELLIDVELTTVLLLYCKFVFVTTLPGDKLNTVIFVGTGFSVEYNYLKKSIKNSLKKYLQTLITNDLKELTKIKDASELMLL